MREIRVKQKKKTNFFLNLWDDCPAIKYNFHICLSSWTACLLKSERCLISLRLFKPTAGIWPNRNSRRGSNTLRNCVSLDKPAAQILFLESSENVAVFGAVLTQQGVKSTKEWQKRRSANHVYHLQWHHPIHRCVNYRCPTHTPTASSRDLRPVGAAAAPSQECSRLPCHHCLVFLNFLSPKELALRC